MWVGVAPSAGGLTRARGGGRAGALSAGAGSPISCPRALALPGLGAVDRDRTAPAPFPGRRLAGHGASRSPHLRELLPHDESLCVHGPPLGSVFLENPDLPKREASGPGILGCRWILSLILGLFSLPCFLFFFFSLEKNDVGA